MYTFEQAEKGFDILDPDGDTLANVETQGEAESLISHLNRGN